jgi:hypothetical protein
MHRRLSALLAILALSLTTALLVGPGSASASVLEPPTSIGDSQADGPGGGDDPGPGSGTGGGDPNEGPCDEFTMEPCTAGPDGGGGSGGGSFTGLGLPASQEVADEIITRTRDATRNALGRRKCFELLSLDDSPSPNTFNPFRVLDTVPIRYVNDRTLDLGFSPGLGVDGRIDILNGFFAITFNSAYRYRGYIDSSIYFDLPVVQLTREDMQLVIMLHELGHLTGTNVHAGDDGDGELEPAEAGQDFNTQIYLHCLPQGAAYQ